MTTLLLVVLLGQTSSPYMLIGDTVHPVSQTRQIEPTPQPSPQAETWGWYKLKQRPNWLKTSWVWGQKDAVMGIISWVPEDQEAAWQQTGKKMPMWVKRDATGQEWEHWDADALLEHVRVLDAKRTVRTTTPMYTSAPTYTQTPTYSSAPVYSLAPMLQGGFFGGGFESGVSRCGPGGCN